MSAPVRLAILLAVVALAGCAAGPGAQPAPVDDLGARAPGPGAGAAPPAAGVGAPAPDGPVVRPLPETAPPEARPVSPAVVALVNAAGRQSRAGETDRAAASLERALQIEPRNAWLWHRLARVRLQQGQLDPAASLAARSSALAGENHRLVADNWRLIAEVRERQGRNAEAREAAARADALGAPPR